MNMKTKILKTALSFSALTLLAACAGGEAPEVDATNAKLDSAIERAEEQTSMETKTPSLSTAEKAYNKDSKDPVNAVHYAAALREAGYANRASAILTPFADSAKSAPGVKTEFAAIQLALGNNESAEKYAQKAVIQDPNDAKAFHYLGIALDAQGKHPEAERAFRKGLDMWKGDPTPIMNNLALNLSAQGFLDEAVEILQRAKELSPGRVEIERNLRIVTALRQSGNPTTPKPVKKPK
jgi:Flp pilus assembly protein TadD